MEIHTGRVLGPQPAGFDLEGMSDYDTDVSDTGKRMKLTTPPFLHGEWEEGSEAEANALYRSLLVGYKTDDNT